MASRASSSIPLFTPVKASTATVIRRALLIFSGIYSAWERVQVSRHGAYTARRARALERYLYSASMARVLAVCTLTPLPILAFVLLQELVPLDAPQAGWRANYRWLVRSTIIFTVLTLSYIQQGVIFLAPLKVSKKQALVITFSTTAAYFLVLVVVSTSWMFPIPFACVLTTGVFTIVFFGLFVAVIGWHTLIDTPRLSAHARIWSSDRRNNHSVYLPCIQRRPPGDAWSSSVRVLVCIVSTEGGHALRHGICPSS
ncbi:hypothetical protein ON010_g8715 [Phytophthora cinnamomi]|nr:hypothetical protein ON010_g8715 [Phytophthora cinnamomi]